MNDDPILSALVVLHPAGGVLTGGESITARTVSRFEPDPEDVARAQGHFRSLGFETTPLVGLSFSITGPKSLFEKTFGAGIVPDEQGGARLVNEERDLPLDRLPRQLAERVASITFPPPPEFGPGNP